MRLLVARNSARLLVAVAFVAITVGCAGEPVTSGSADTSAQVAGTWDEIVAAAEEEGQVTLYTPYPDAIVDALEPAFENTYPGIDLQIVKGLPQDNVPRLEAERQTGRGIADVYVAADYQWMVEAGKQGYFTTPVGPHFDVADYDKATNIRGEGYFLTHAATYGWAWNTNELPDGLSSYTDLLNPALKGRIAVVEPSNQALVDFWAYLEEQGGEGFIDALAQQEPRIYPGSGPVMEALASGEVAATVYAGAGTEVIKAAGAPVEWTLPEDPWGPMHWTAILAIAPHPNAAQVLADFLVSPDGQQILGRDNAPVLPGMPGARAVVTEVTERNVEDITPEAVQEYYQGWREDFV